MHPMKLFSFRRIGPVKSIPGYNGYENDKNCCANQKQEISVTSMAALRKIIISKKRETSDFSHSIWKKKINQDRKKKRKEIYSSQFFDFHFL